MKYKITIINFVWEFKVSKIISVIKNFFCYVNSLKEKNKKKKEHGFK